MELSSGTDVNDSLRLRRLLGEGAMGSVWIAEHRKLGVDVAVKFIARDHRRRNRDLVVARFEREARLAAQIKSPHVVQIYDHGLMDDDTPYIVMELLEGESLGTRLRRAGALPADDVIAIVEQVCKALGRAHELGIVHRDVKPDNIFLLAGSDEVFVKMLDFGIAKVVEDTEQAMTTTGAMLGTPLYMSPETIRSAREVTTSADLWALAVVAYEALLGEPPFAGETVGALFFAICGESVPPPSERRKGLAPELDGWFSRALCQDLDKRFASARALAQTFAAAARGEAWHISTDRGSRDADGASVAELTEAAPQEASTPPSSPRRAPQDALDTAEFLSQEQLAIDAPRSARKEEARTLVAADGPNVASQSERPAHEAATAEGDARGSRSDHGSEGHLPSEEGLERDATEDGSAPPYRANNAQPAPKEPTRRRRWPVALGLAAVATAGGVWAFDAPRGRPPDPPRVASEPVPLRVRCEPACDTVVVDGTRHAREEFAALARADGEEPTKGELRVKLAPGPHRVVALREGHRERVVEVALSPDHPEELTIALERAEGSLGRDAFAATWDGAAEKLDDCAEQARTRGEPVKGALDVRFVIDPRGDVDEIALDGDLGDADFLACVEDILRATTFAAPSPSGFVSVRRTIAFEVPIAALPPRNNRLPPPVLKRQQKHNRNSWSVPSTGPGPQSQKQGEPQLQKQGEQRPRQTNNETIYE